MTIKMRKPITYIVLALLGSALNSVMIEGLNSKYNLFLTIMAMPGFISGGNLYTDNFTYNGTCSDLIECSYLICHYNYYYKAVNNTVCSLQQYNEETISHTVFIADHISRLRWSTVVYLILTSVTLTYLVITQTYKQRTIHVSCTIHVAINLLSQMIIQMYIAYVNYYMVVIRPHLPDFVVDNDIIMYDVYYTVCFIHILVTLLTSLYEAKLIINDGYEILRSIRDNEDPDSLTFCKKEDDNEVSSSHTNSE